MHRPFAQFGEATEAARADGSVEQRFNEPSFTIFKRQAAELSQRVCIDNAIRVGKIIKYHQENLKRPHVSATGMDHVGTAALTLQAGLRGTNNTQEQFELAKHLSCLVEVLELNSPNY